jgi:hypothetical protein
MSQYYVRSDDGLMIARVSNSIASKMMDSSPGNFVKKTFTSGRTPTCFVFDSEFSFGMDGFALMIWKGYYLEPSNN